MKGRGRGKNRERKQGVRKSWRYKEKITHLRKKEKNGKIKPHSKGRNAEVAPPATSITRAGNADRCMKFVKSTYGQWLTFFMYFLFLCFFLFFLPRTLRYVAAEDSERGQYIHTVVENRVPDRVGQRSRLMQVLSSAENRNWYDGLGPRRPWSSDVPGNRGLKPSVDG